MKIEEEMRAQNTQSLIKYLELTKQEVAHHHDALWEEEKHYTWWVYIIFAAIGFLYVNPDIFGFSKALPIFLLALFGIWASFLGYKVIKREGEHFYQSRRKYIAAAKSLGVDKIVFLTLDNGKTLTFEDLEGIKGTDNSLSKETADLNKMANQLCKPGIRTFFQWNFIITGVIFLLISLLFLAISLGTCFAHVHRFIR